MPNMPSYFNEYSSQPDKTEEVPFMQYGSSRPNSNNEPFSPSASTLDDGSLNGPNQNNQPIDSNAPFASYPYQYDETPTDVQYPDEYYGNDYGLPQIPSFLQPFDTYGDPFVVNGNPDYDSPDYKKDGPSDIGKMPEQFPGRAPGAFGMYRSFYPPSDYKDNEGPPNYEYGNYPFFQPFRMPFGQMPFDDYLYQYPNQPDDDGSQLPFQGNPMQPETYQDNQNYPVPSFDKDDTQQTSPPQDESNYPGDSQPMEDTSDNMPPQSPLQYYGMGFPPSEYEPAEAYSDMVPAQYPPQYSGTEYAPSEYKPSEETNENMPPQSPPQDTGEMYAPTDSNPSENVSPQTPEQNVGGYAPPEYEPSQETEYAPSYYNPSDNIPSANPEQEIGTGYAPSDYSYEYYSYDNDNGDDGGQMLQDAAPQFDKPVESGSPDNEGLLGAPAPESDGSQQPDSPGSESPLGSPMFEYYGSGQPNVPDNDDLLSAPAPESDESQQPDSPGSESPLGMPMYVYYEYEQPNSPDNGYLPEYYEYRQPDTPDNEDLLSAPAPESDDYQPDSPGSDSPLDSSMFSYYGEPNFPDNADLLGALAPEYDESQQPDSLGSESPVGMPMYMYYEYEQPNAPENDDLGSTAPASDEYEEPYAPDNDGLLGAPAPTDLDSTSTQVPDISSVPEGVQPLSNMLEILRKEISPGDSNPDFQQFAMMLLRILDSTDEGDDDDSPCCRMKTLLLQALFAAIQYIAKMSAEQ